MTTQKCLLTERALRQSLLIKSLKVTQQMILQRSKLYFLNILFIFREKRREGEKEGRRLEGVRERKGREGGGREGDWKGERERYH